MTNTSTPPAGTDMKGVLSAMPSRINPGPPRLRIHFHTESDNSNRENIFMHPGPGNLIRYSDAIGEISNTLGSVRNLLDADHRTRRLTDNCVSICCQPAAHSVLRTSANDNQVSCHSFRVGTNRLRRFAFLNVYGGRGGPDRA